MAEQNEPQGDRAPIAASLSGFIIRIAEEADEAAFEQVFKHFAPRLKSFFMRLGADVSSAEEIAQETLVLVWRNAGQFDPLKSSVSTWVFTIARNLSIDRFRRGRRPQFDAADPAFVPDNEMAADLQLERAETEQKVRDVMNSLSPNEKSVLMLSYYENRSHGEIARQLSLPLGTVKSRIRLAFAKIRAALDAQAGAGE